MLTLTSDLPPSDSNPAVGKLREDSAYLTLTPTLTPTLTVTLTPTLTLTRSSPKPLYGVMRGVVLRTLSQGQPLPNRPGLMIGVLYYA